MIVLYIGVGLAIVISTVALCLHFRKHTHEVGGTIDHPTAGDILRRKRFEDRIEKVIIGETLRGRK